MRVPFNVDGKNLMGQEGSIRCFLIGENLIEVTNDVISILLIVQNVIIIANNRNGHRSHEKRYE